MYWHFVDVVEQPERQETDRIVMLLEDQLFEVDEVP